MAGRPRLSQPDYVAAAFTIADGIGIQALTLKALGQHLGVDSTAVYRHFRSKDVLLVAMLDQLLTQQLQPSETFATGREEVEHIIDVLHRVLVANPPLAAALVATSDLPDSSVRLVDRTVDALARMGLAGDALVATYQTLEYFVLGTCILDGDGAVEDWSARRRRFDRIASREFRNVARSGSEMQRIAERSFRDGIRVLLDACDAR